MKRAVVVQHRLTHCCELLFELLGEALAAKGVLVEVLVGWAARVEQENCNTGRLPWATPLPARYPFMFEG